MPHNPATWARRIAFGMDVSKPGVELHHYICAGYYSCTETGFGEMIRPRMHVWVCMSYAYAPGVSSDRRATAYEPMLITHIECTADGLGIQIFGRAMLNWPRLRRYTGSHKAPAALKKDPSLYVYTDWEIVARADSQEGFVGVCIGPPAAPPDLSDACEDTIGCIGYMAVCACRNPPLVVDALTALAHTCASAASASRLQRLRLETKSLWCAASSSDTTQASIADQLISTRGSRISRTMTWSLSSIQGRGTCTGGRAAAVRKRSPSPSTPCPRRSTWDLGPCWA